MFRKIGEGFAFVGLMVVCGLLIVVAVVFALCAKPAEQGVKWCEKKLGALKKP